MLFNLFQPTKTISPKEAKENLDKFTDIILLDVREKDEYKRGHIKNAKLMPVGEIMGKIESLSLSKEATIYVYCQSGARSSRAYSMLSKMGYKNVYNLGGIMSWPYEITL